MTETLKNGCVQEAEDSLAASVLRLRARSPFIGTLALFAKRTITRAVPTAATDGKTLYFNPDFTDRLSSAEMDGLLAHELLHAALRHPGRLRGRDPFRWNVAADVVVNGMIASEDGLELPAGGIRETELERHEAEEVYDLLGKNERMKPYEKYRQRYFEDLLPCPPGCDPGPMNGEDAAELKAHWDSALRQAATLQRMNGRGNLSAGLARVMAELDLPELDWRALLWRYLVRTPVDYGEYDRRHLWNRQYVEGLAGEKLRVFACIDTSGSIDQGELSQFLSEVRGILAGYAHVQVSLYYCDAAVDGPHDLSSVGDEIPPPKGGGGTSFCPFFEAVADETDPFGESVAVYLTDGFGEFPENPPSQDVLWVVTPGGLPNEGFPFGQVTRMTNSQQRLQQA